MKSRTERAATAATRQAAREGRIWLLMAPILALIWVVSPGVETRIWPVVTPAAIVATEDLGGGWSRVELEAEKLRDCDWRSVEWFLGARGANGPSVQAYFADPPQIRERGVLRWKDLRVRLPEHLLLTGSYGDVLHQCYGPALGKTRSWFYR
ncbi:hypothetical protein KO516_14370 [Citreicella sp. C3M06]|uniref:hypothetical protein n=1 Tax=Citreicella sp. C3M06 TaxID=2841564 RepID=UPI001C08CB46|nr:hypothetical protein [Citreicella sp. C3M06]MBU2961972.1 hypothetical protein [Citreicella sp. C3M06]